MIFHFYVAHPRSAQDNRRTGGDLKSPSNSKTMAQTHESALSPPETTRSGHECSWIASSPTLLAVPLRDLRYDGPFHFPREQMAV